MSDVLRSGLTPSELWLAEELWQELKRLEQTSISESELISLGEKLKALTENPNPALQKIGNLQVHLRPGLSPRQLHLLLVPVERLLDRNKREDQFLMTSEDHKIAKTHAMRPIVFILDHLRSGFNVGSIFRLGDCVGTEKIWLVGYTATPEQKTVQDTALGTSAWVNWQHHDDLSTVIRQLQKDGYKVIALETAERATPLYSGPLPKKVAFLVGNERFGLNLEALEWVDEVRIIPMHGTKNSLNVANALSVAAFEWGRQNP